MFVLDVSLAGGGPPLLTSCFGSFDEVWVATLILLICKKKSVMDRKLREPRLPFGEKEAVDSLRVGPRADEKGGEERLALCGYIPPSEIVVIIMFGRGRNTSRKMQRQGFASSN